MKRNIVVMFSLLVTIALVALAFAGVEKGKMDLKVGDEVYACNCGEKCPCNTMAMKPAKCSCGNDMVKAKVMKVEEGKAYLKADAWPAERVFKTTGKYACACEGSCNCGMISQNPGKCACGNEMKKVE